MRRPSGILATVLLVAVAVVVVSAVLGALLAAIRATVTLAALLLLGYFAFRLYASVTGGHPRRFGR